MAPAPMPVPQMVKPLRLVARAALAPLAAVLHPLLCQLTRLWTDEGT